jgi:aromatic ring hydroxylase
MGVRTGWQFLEGLKDDRQIFLDGERIADVTRDKRLAAAAYSVAELLRYAARPGARREDDVYLTVER